MKERHEAHRLVGYCRVSTENQVDEGVSLDAQRARLEQYAALYELELVSIHTDAGLSAKSLDRPGLQAALADLKRGRADGILITKLDRLTRSVRDLVDVVEEYFTAGKWSLVSLGEQIDTRTAGGRMLINMLAVISQWERETIGERTRDALAHLRTRGVRLGAAPFGWMHGDDVDGDGRRIVAAVQAEKKAVQRIMRLRRQGNSLRAIADVLSSEGYSTKRGGKWQAQTVANVLKRENSEDDYDS